VSLWDDVYIAHTDNASAYLANANLYRVPEAVQGLVRSNDGWVDGLWGGDTVRCLSQGSSGPRCLFGATDTAGGKNIPSVSGLL